ncbi:hypothetical protein ACFL96_14195 [Thermoproteota archaeon]
MIFQMMKNILYVPNIWQNRILDEIGLIIIVLGVSAGVIHFAIRHVRPPIKETH